MNNKLQQGKIPEQILSSFFAELEMTDPAVVVRPTVGEDNAAVDVTGEEVIVLKSDPITFATDAIAEYAVLINANDIATSGAVPRWFLTTVLLPEGTPRESAQSILSNLAVVCGRYTITLCGGHTEITDAVNRPVVSGALIGTVGRGGLIDKKNMRPGDTVLVTKAAGVEGTSVIAREFETKLRQAGIEETVLSRAKEFIDRIGILEEARIAASFGPTVVSAMHDVTEGGIATAIRELGKAGGVRIRIDMDKIPLYGETEEICDAMDIDPLGLIGSGCLLICCRAGKATELTARLEEAGIETTVLGEVTGEAACKPGEIASKPSGKKKPPVAGDVVEAYHKGKKVPFPVFEVDEITKLYTH